MPEIRDGQIFTLDEIKSNQFTYRGKEVKFEQNENNPNVYEGKIELSDEEKQAGNPERSFSFNIGTAQGIVSLYTAPPDTEDFQDLTDSEKVTKLNSIEYQHNTTEPTDTGEGLDAVLEKDMGKAQPQNKEELNKVLSEQKQNQEQQKQTNQQQQQAQQQKGIPTGATTSKTTEDFKNREKYNISNVKSAES
jgi:hypothetical protein